MNEDRPSSAAEGRSTRTWLEKLGQILQGDLKNREDLIETLSSAHDNDLLDADAFHMMMGVLSVSEMKARDIMIPRPQMVVVERDAALTEFLPVIIESAHSRFPVIGENRDEVIGLLLAKDLLAYVGQPEERFNIRDLLRPALIIPESKRLDVLLKEFRSSQNHMAVVVDEYGGVAGLVTIEDVLEQIVGEIADEHDVDDDDTNILPAGENLFTVRALTPIEDFNAFFNTDLSDDEFDTIGGLVMNGFGHLPKRGEEQVLAGYHFTVLRADNRRIYQFEVKPVQAVAGDRLGADEPTRNPQQD